MTRLAMKEQEIINHIAISRLHGMGTKNFRRLINEFNSTENLLKAPASEISKLPKIREDIVRGLKKELDFREAEEIYRKETDKNSQVLAYLDPAYPSRLRRMADGPIVLYYRGSADLNAGRTVGIVGTRTPTPDGLLLTEQLISQLIPYKVVTISGLAMGIDGASHKHSLEQGIPTVGVLGGGHDFIYPANHKGLADQMRDNGGLLTEFVHDQKVVREHFPMRNRIIAGLSDALVVVESKQKGGSMITAQLAFDYNRYVFAFPGKPFDEKSRGCNKLIKTHVASLMETADDIAEQLNWDVESGQPAAAQGLLFSEITEDEMLIVDILREEGRVHVDKLSLLAKCRPGKLANLLLELELKGMVQSLPGKLYRLKNRIN